MGLHCTIKTSKENSLNLEKYTNSKNKAINKESQIAIYLNILPKTNSLSLINKSPYPIIITFY